MFLLERGARGVRGQGERRRRERALRSFALGALLVGALALGACDGIGAQTPEPEPICPETWAELHRCQQDLLEVCRDGRWQVVTPCTATDPDFTCIEQGAGVAHCALRPDVVELFEPCGVGIGGCRQGARCALSAAQNHCQCVEPCGVDPAVCGEGAYCDLTEFATGACMALVPVGEPCPGDAACTPGASCVAATGGGGSSCLIPCDETSPCSNFEYCDSTRYAQPVCLPRATELAPCSPTTGPFCRQGLQCTPRGEEHQCLRPCGDDAPCPVGDACDPTLSACLPLVAEKGPCGDGVGQCLADLTCSTFTPEGGPAETICVRACGDNPARCLPNETCDTTGVYGASACVPVAARFEPCGDGVAACALGLVCPSTGTKICVDNCEGNAVCAVDEYCDTTIAAGGACLPTGGGRNAPCLHQNGCDPSLNCIALAGPTKTCERLCAPTEVGAQGSCPEGELCLPRGSVDLQGGLLNPVACVDDTGCDQAQGYTCRTLVDPLGGPTANRCARDLGVCGVPLPPKTAFTTRDLRTTPAAERCGLAGEDGLCLGTLPDNATAEVRCAETGFAEAANVGGSPLPCQSDDDCRYLGSQLVADLECLSFAAGDYCASRTQVCVAFCESEDGNELYTCPNGLACQSPRPPNVGLGARFLRGGGGTCSGPNDPECSETCVESQGSYYCLAPCSADADCGPGWWCDSGYSVGPLCARTQRVCMPPQNTHGGGTVDEPSTTTQCGAG